VSARANDSGLIRERELEQLIGDLDDMRHDPMPRGPSRRRFLIGSGAAVLGGLLFTACGGNKTSPSAGGTATTATGGVADLAVAALAAALENLAVGTYQAALDAATAGTLGPVPPAVVTFATTVQQHHRDHAAAWNSVLTGAGKEAVTGVDLTLKADVDKAFADVKDVGGLARLALSLENTAAATYQNGIEILGDTGAIQVAASIQPVEMQHVAILNFVLGTYPVPDAFSKTTLARTSGDQIGTV
jgi:hypothetical protein